MSKNSLSTGDAEYRTMLDRCMEELRLKTEAHAGAWGLSTTDRWVLAGARE